jgi:hypothetical protein
MSKRFGKQQESTHDRNERDPRGPKCYKCFGYGHVHKDCANLKSNKPRDQKSFNITLSDTDEEVPDENADYVAFAVSFDYDDSK